MKAELIINRNFTVGRIDRRIYGSFIEQLGGLYMAVFTSPIIPPQTIRASGWMYWTW